jgi:cytochrome P450
MTQSTVNLKSHSLTTLPVAMRSMTDFSRDPIACMQGLQATHGNLVALREGVGNKQLIFAFGPEYNRQLLSRADNFHSQFFAIRGSKNSAQRRLTSGLLSMNGDEHTQQRRLVMSAFQRRAIPAYLNMVRHFSSEMLDEWHVGESIDVADEMTRLMLKITSSILFGMEDEAFACRLGEMMEKWVQMNHELGMAAFVADADYIPQYQQLLEFAEELEENLRVLITRRESSPSSNESDVLSLLIQARQHGAALTDEQMIGQTALLFAAAHMTTAHSLSWTMFLLAQHPEIFAELTSELKNAPSPSLLTPPTHAPMARPPSTGIKGQPTSVLDRVIRESMRILPASAYSQRICVAQSELGGVTIPAGSVVVFSQFMTHRDESIYQDSDQFKPDRWLHIKPGAYEYLPFGGGSRLCIGAPLATAIMQTVLPAVFQRTQLQVAPQAEINARVVSTMLTPTHGIPMIVSHDKQVDSVPCQIHGNLRELVNLPSSIHQRALSSQQNRAA